MSQTTQVPDNVPVSWLQHLEHITNDVLMLASEPSADTQTEYMSKYFTYYDLYEQLSDTFDLEGIRELTRILWDEKIWLSSYLNNSISCDIPDPYVISSIRQGYTSDEDGNVQVGILSVSGYRLSAALYNVFNNFYRSGRNLSDLIPSLGYHHEQAEKEKAVVGTYDANGHIIGFDTASISDLGGASIYMKNDTKNEVRLTELHLIKLTYDDFKTLSVNNLLNKDYLYMTINDPVK